MKVILFFFLFYYPVCSFSYEVEDILEAHYKRLERFERQDLSYTEKQVKKILVKLHENKLTDQMLNYFSSHPYELFIFREVSVRAEKLSRAACSLASAEKRPVNDEADAIRHIIWSSLLTLKLGEKKALDIMSMQENRPNSNWRSFIMDLSNNQIGVDFVRENKSLLFGTRKERRQKIVNKKVIKFAKKQLFFGNLKVYISKESPCRNVEMYPNI